MAIFVKIIKIYFSWKDLHDQSEQKIIKNIIESCLRVLFVHVFCFCLVLFVCSCFLFFFSFSSWLFLIYLTFLSRNSCLHKLPGIFDHALEVLHKTIATRKAILMRKPTKNNTELFPIYNSTTNQRWYFSCQYLWKYLASDNSNAIRRKFSTANLGG